MNRLGPVARRPPRPRAVSAGLTVPSYMVQTNNGGRIEQVPGFEVGRVMSQGFGARRLPEGLTSDRLANADWLEYAFPQSILGKDDRAPIMDTTRLPWRCICHLVSEGLHDEQVIGTGWMAGPRTVLTAGHNLFSHRRSRGARRVTVVPGRNGDLAPFGFYRSTRFEVHARWQQFGDPLFDVGVVWLDAPVGDRIGWFGFGSRPDAALKNIIVNTSGYPADKRIGTQWFNAGRVSDLQPRALGYGLDTQEGQSGSPIFALAANDERTVVAVHAYGGDAENRGVRITDDIFRLFAAWRR